MDGWMDGWTDVSLTNLQKKCRGIQYLIQSYQVTYLTGKYNLFYISVYRLIHKYITE